MIMSLSLNLSVTSLCFEGQARMRITVSFNYATFTSHSLQLDL